MVVLILAFLFTALAFRELNLAGERLTFYSMDTILLPNPIRPAPSETLAKSHLGFDCEP